MKRIAVLFSLLLGLLVPASAQLSMTGVGGGFGGVAAGGGYIGPVDAIASPLGCWSLRACTAALRGNAVANVCVTGVCADMLSNATTGDLVTQTINGVSCPNNTGNCLVKTLYFQTGTMTCSTTCDLNNNTLSSANPVLSNSCGALGKSFCMLFVAANSVGVQSVSGITSTTPQGLTLIAVAMQTGSLGANNGIWSNNAGPIQLSFSSSVSASAFIYAGGGNATQSQTINSWHSLIGVANGASSITSVDAVSGSTVNSGANGLTAGSVMSLGRSTFNEYMTGDVVEVLVYPSAFSAGNNTTMCHNQFAYWGTSTSC